jgi:hypothetical protein
MRQPTSNVKCERFAQPLKHDPQILSTDAGMQIEGSDEQPEKADAPRIEIRQGDSKAKSRSCGQPEKQKSLMT